VDILQLVGNGETSYFQGETIPLNIAKSTGDVIGLKPNELKKNSLYFNRINPNPGPYTIRFEFKNVNASQNNNDLSVI